MWSLSDLTNKGSDARALVNKGAVPFGAGIEGVAASAAVFSGSTAQALYIADSGAADPFRIRTGSFGCWFRTAKRGVGQRALSKRAAQMSWQLQIGAGNTVGPYVSTTGGDVFQAAGVSDVCDDRWHFAVATCDGTMLRNYVDGVLEGAVTVTGPMFGSSAPLNIGGMSGDGSVATGEPFFGRVDEAFVTADVLTEDQIRILYATKKPHTLTTTPTDVRLNVHRKRKGAALATTDFPATPLRLHNFTAGALTDQGSNGQALTNNGAAVAVAGADGSPSGGFSFAGAQSLSATDAGLPAALASRSYGCWFKTTTIGQPHVMAWGAYPNDTRTAVNAGLLMVVSGPDVITGPFVADGQWHMFVTTEDNAAGDGVRRKVYLDGRLVGGSTVMNSTALGGANRFRVGASADGSNPFTGQIDGAFVTGTALTPEHVAVLYAKGAQDLGASPKNPGDHIERVDATDVYAIFDTLESQHTVDLAVVA